MSFEDNNLDDHIGWDNEYVCSFSEYSDSEFAEICKNALKDVISKHGDNNICYLKDELVENYGFKPIKITAFFDYEEK